MADAEVGRVLENLKDFIRYNPDLIGGVATQCQMLTKQLEMLRVFLKEYRGQNHTEDATDKSLLNNISDLVLEAEDSIETFVIYASRQKLRGSIDKAFHAVDHVLNLRRATKQIEEVTTRLQSLYQDKATMSLQDLKIEDSPKDVQYTKKTLVLEEEDNVVGFEDEVKNVIDLLTEESEKLEVISIIGMHGLGKTTLAKKVLNDPLIEYEFYPRVFVNISPRYQKKEVFLSILGAFSQIDQEIYRMSDNELAEILWQKLMIRKYFIVMDDVWTSEAWDDLKVVFPENKMNSRVLITSRHTHVALRANPKCDPRILQLRFLSLDESRELLRMKVFGKDSILEEFEEYESHILQKCDGLPLAIVLVAGVLLNHRHRIDWWKKVANGLNDHAALDPVQSNSIALSFNHLPYQLKPCFLYLGIFPEGFEIPVRKLLRLWIAEGFVEPEGQKSLEDIAEDYLLELVGRSLVKVGRKRVNGQIKTCHISGTLLDFCKKEGTKENLFQQIRFDQTTPLQESPSLNSYRRICINSHVLNYFSAKPSGQLVRSFLSFPKQETILPLEHVSTIPRAFSLLKVLDGRSIIFTRFPRELFYLILLKYIAISCRFSSLPEKMSNLRNLQTLIIETSARTFEIKADIWKMPLLKHVEINAPTSFLKVRGEPSINYNLQTLSTISPESCQKEVFESAPNLKKLSIRGKLATILEATGDSSLFDCLIKLEHLANLKLLNDDITSSLYALPNERNFPKNLRSLTLLNTLLDWRHMSTLGKLENLEVLKLKDNAFQGEFWQTEDGGFHSLKVLYIGSTNLVLWKTSASHFPILTTLFIRYCSKLEAIPLSLGDIPSLQSIDLYFTNYSAASSARRIQVLKLRLQAQRGHSKGSGFKLSVYPPDQ